MTSLTSLLGIKCERLWLQAPRCSPTDRTMKREIFSCVPWAGKMELCGNHLERLSKKVSAKLHLSKKKFMDVETEEDSSLGSLERSWLDTGRWHWGLSEGAVSVQRISIENLPCPEGSSARSYLDL